MSHTPPALLTLQEKIKDCTAMVGVVGLGYLGLPFAVEKAKVGFRLLGIEQNPRRAEQAAILIREILLKLIENSLKSPS
ncbi:hypothetical protein [Laspinema palackyanum]|uniref:hypothetical protein n=1 Tax=Laspinema palackyanum TaxID=3231601 RepID=UPI00345DD2FA|nr:hypothetical protein [Laspinema sp. D2c]